MFFDTHLNLFDTCYESAFIQKTTVSSFISTDISVFLPLKRWSNTAWSDDLFSF